MRYLTRLCPKVLKLSEINICIYESFTICEHTSHFQEEILRSSVIFGPRECNIARKVSTLKSQYKRG